MALTRRPRRFGPSGLVMFRQRASEAGVPAHLVDRAYVSRLPTGPATALGHALPEHASERARTARANALTRWAHRHGGHA